MEGIPVHPPERRRTNVVVPLAPPPLEVSEVSLASPHSATAKGGGRSIARAVKESAEPENEDVWSDKVD